jgi:hypothetical protein
MPDRRWTGEEKANIVLEVYPIPEYCKFVCLLPPYSDLLQTQDFYELESQVLMAKDPL